MAGCTTKFGDLVQPLLPPVDWNAAGRRNKERRKPHMGSSLRRRRYSPETKDVVSRWDGAHQQVQGCVRQGLHAKLVKRAFYRERGAGRAARQQAQRKVYKINDYNGEPVTGTWYDEELKHISNNQYRIERVIRQRTAADGTKEILVKWEGWPEKFNSWIREEDQYNVAG